MKNFFKYFLKFYLKYITKITVYAHQPIIIAVAGSINKPFVKQEIKKILESQGLKVRANPKNFNTEIGLPLAVLSLESGYNSFKKWLPIIKQAPRCIFQKDFPQYLILSLGTSDPGDMEYLLSIVRPDIAVITDVTQRYLETFNNVDALLEEYQNLAKKLPAEGYLIINKDNRRLKKISESTKAKVIFYGFDANADFCAKNPRTTATGQIFDIKTRTSNENVEIRRFGNHHIYSALIGRIIKTCVNKQAHQTK